MFSYNKLWKILIDKQMLRKDLMAMTSITSTTIAKMGKGLPVSMEGEQRMKIEMGESLLYSWLRHVKNCQVVQTNWKPSPNWKMQNAEEQRELMKISDEYFQQHGEYDIFKKNEIDQLLSQAEVDVLGICRSDGGCPWRHRRQVPAFPETAVQRVLGNGEGT